MENKIINSRYKILKKVGGGGMAQVYHGHDIRLNRPVAIKILKDELMEKAEFIKRFEIEVQSVAALSHPNIVHIHDVGEEDNIHYIIMEYVDGMSLKESIKSKKVYPWNEAQKFILSISDALKHAIRKR